MSPPPIAVLIAPDATHPPQSNFACYSARSLLNQVQSGHLQPSRIVRLEIYSTSFNDPDLPECVHILSRVHDLLLGTPCALGIGDLEDSATMTKWSSLPQPLRRNIIHAASRLRSLTLRGLSELPLPLFRLCRKLTYLDFELVKSIVASDREVPALVCDPALVNPQFDSVPLGELRFRLVSSLFAEQFIQKTVCAHHPVFSLQYLKRLAICALKYTERESPGISHLFTVCASTLERLEFHPAHTGAVKRSGTPRILDLSAFPSLKKLKLWVKTSRNAEENRSINPSSQLIIPTLNTLKKREQSAPKVGTSIEFYFPAFSQSFDPSFLGLNEVVTWFRNQKRKKLVESLSIHIQVIKPEPGVSLNDFAAVQRCLEKDASDAIREVCTDGITLLEPTRLNQVLHEEPSPENLAHREPIGSISSAMLTSMDDSIQRTYEEKREPPGCISTAMLTLLDDPIQRTYEQERERRNSRPSQHAAREHSQEGQTDGPEYHQDHPNESLSRSSAARQCPQQGQDRRRSRSLSSAAHDSRYGPGVNSRENHSGAVGPSRLHQLPPQEFSSRRSTAPRVREQSQGPRQSRYLSGAIPGDNRPGQYNPSLRQEPPRASSSRPFTAQGTRYESRNSRDAVPRDPCHVLPLIPAQGVARGISRPNTRWNTSVFGHYPGFAPSTAADYYSFLRDQYQYRHY